MTAVPHQNRRILVIDDNKAIHEDFRKILVRAKAAPSKLAAAEAALFGEQEPKLETPHFEIDSAFQGQEGLDLIEKSLREGRPYAMAFVDVRMPPGWDGVETTTQIWKKYAELQVVICTAYSDYSWEEMLKKLGYSDRLVILKKPFDNIEVLQLAISMTEKWRLYEQAKIHLNELESLVHQRTSALERANADLEAANDLLMVATEKTQKMAERVLMASKSKSEFLANMSHEIRTPMNGVIGMVNLLMDTPLSSDQRECAHTIKTSADALLTIINDILDFSKIEAGKMTFERVHFNLREAVTHAVALLLPRAQEQNIRLTYSIDDSIPNRLLGDPSRLRQILLNLLGNAVKFAPQGEVHLHIAQVSEAGEEIELHFSVRDTGIGISQEAQRNLFQAFTQADASTTRKFGGTGLGLAICGKLVDLMSGAIGVESVLGKGSTFWFILKFTRGYASSLSRTGTMPHPETPKQFSIGAQELEPNNARIILAEDNKTNQLVAIRQLKKLGFTNVQVAGNGVEAVQAWQQNKDCIIFMDCQMPELDGYAATQKIREMEIAGHLPHTHIIAMTANAMQGDRELCLSTGMDDYISKPVNVGELKNALLRAKTVASATL